VAVAAAAAAAARILRFRCSIPRTSGQSPALERVPLRTTQREISASRTPPRGNSLHRPEAWTVPAVLQVSACRRVPGVPPGCGCLDLRPKSGSEHVSWPGRDSPTIRGAYFDSCCRNAGKTPRDAILTHGFRTRRSVQTVQVCSEPRC